MVDFEAFKPVLYAYAKNITDIDRELLTAALPIVEKVFDLSPDISPEILEKTNFFKEWKKKKSIFFFFFVVEKWSRFFA